MAQYLPYIPETIPEPALYKPDFNFYDRMLQRKQSLFEQGASRVKSAYSSVLNAPLSNKNLIPLRDQYINDAQEKLKKISSSDLSLMENVNAAEEIFSPFWQNKFMVQDAAITKSYQNEMQKLISWRDSAKPEEREKYSAISMMDLQNGLSKLQNADLTPEAFGAIEMRKAEPFTNIEAYLQKQAKEQGMEVKYDDPNGPYLVETVNGERSQKKYATWATAMVGNNFQGQFDVTGRVENEERIKILKRTNPNLSDADIQSIIAKDVVSELNQGYTKRHQEVDVELARVDSLLGSIGQNGGPQNKAMFDKLVAERSELTAKKAAINEEYKYFDQGKSKVLEYVTSAPKQYFSVLAKQRLINNWATGRASIDQKLIKENAAWTAASTADLNNRKFELDVMKAGWEHEKQLWDMAHPNTKSSDGSNKTGGSGDTGNNVPGVDESGSLVYSGHSGIDITKTAETAYDIFSKNQKQAFNDAHNLIFDQKGILGFATKLGLSQLEISQVATAMQKEIATDYAYNFTKEEEAASNKLSKALLTSQGVKTAGITKITGPSSLRSALIAYAGDYLSERSKVAADGSDIPLSNSEFEALMRYSTAVVKLDSYNANEANRQKILNDKLGKDPNFASVIKKHSDGTSSLLTISELAEDMPTLELRKKIDMSKVTLSKEDVAKYYMQGKVNQTDLGDFTLDGNTYLIESVDGKKMPVFFGLSDSGTAQWNEVYNNKLTKKYGTSEEFAKKMKDANLAIVPDLLMYKNLTGREGSLFALNTKANKTMANGDNAALIIYQAVQPGNVDDVYDKDGNKLDQDKIKSIQALLSSEKNIEEYGTGQYIPQGINGKKTIRYIFSKPISSETKEEVGGKNLNDITKDTQINFVVKDNTTGTYLDQLPNNTGFQVYDAITRGKEIKSDPVLDAAGFSYTITPNVISTDGTNTPSYVTVDLKYKVRSNKKDPQTGALTTNVEDKSYLHTINLTGNDAKSPDEIVSYLQSLYLQNMTSNRNVQQEYQNFINKSSGGSTWDPKAALKAAGLEHLLKK